MWCASGPEVVCQNNVSFRLQFQNKSTTDPFKLDFYTCVYGQGPLNFKCKFVFLPYLGLFEGVESAMRPRTFGGGNLVAPFFQNRCRDAILFYFFKKRLKRHIFCNFSCYYNIYLVIVMLSYRFLSDVEQFYGN